MSKIIDQTFYEILEVSPDAPEHEINKAYQRAKQTYSPESPALYTMFTPEEAQELARLIEDAYAVLSNHNSRKEYDKRIGIAPDDQLMSDSANMSSPSPQPQSQNPTPPPQPVKVPEGHAKTRISTYEVDEDFEHEVENTEEFTGELLAKIRSYKNVELNSLSSEIRVSKTYLQAIENDDYTALPATVFVRGFVVQYAKALGLKHDKVASSYIQRLKDARD